jgi:peptidoglycan/xylan/chitin deacetylase (PgdA/CDA1 family)
MIADLDVPVTVFAVGRTVERFPDRVAELARGIDAEFHLHSYSHDLSKSYDFRRELRRGVEAFEDYFGHRPEGYRAPQGNIEPSELAVLDDAGFAFDASVFPSYRPGIYNNLDAPLSPYVPDSAETLVEVPFAATPWTRVPISQSYLKLLGRPFVRYLESTPLPDPLVFDSHLQDFYRTASHDRLDQPLKFLHERNLDRSTDLFRGFVSHLRERGYEFTTVSTVVDDARPEVVGR